MNGPLFLKIMITKFEYTDITNYKAINTDVVSGNAVIKNVKAANQMAFNDFNQLDYVYSNAVPVIQNIGAGSITDGVFNFTNTAGEALIYDGAGNASSQKGTIAFSLITFYSGLASTHQFFFREIKSEGNARNQILIFHHATNGLLYINFRDNNNQIFSYNSSNIFSPIAGEEYVFECNFDIQNKIIRLFVDGELFVSGIYDILRTTVDYNYFGDMGSLKSNFGISNYLRLDNVLHTAAYTDLNIFPTKTGYITPKITIKTDKINNIAIDDNIITNTDIKYIMIKDNTEYYFNAGTWVLSTDDTMSNTAQEVIDNITSFITDTKQINIKAILTNTNYIDTATLNEISFDYSYSGDVPDSIERCTIWGYFYDIIGDVTNDKITIEPVVRVQMYKTSSIILKKIYTMTVDETGFGKIDLVKSEFLSDGRYDVIIQNIRLRFIIPAGFDEIKWSDIAVEVIG